MDHGISAETDLKLCICTKPYALYHTCQNEHTTRSSLLR